MSKESGKQKTASDDPPGRGAEERVEGGGGFASPPCFLHEVDPSWLGYMGRGEMLDLLSALVENVRAIEKCVGPMGSRDCGPAGGAALDGIAKDAARFRCMLERHIERLGGTPSPNTGPLCDDVSAGAAVARADAVRDRQGWVVQRLRDALPGILDESLRADLREMLAAHERAGGSPGGLKP